MYGVHPAQKVVKLIRRYGGNAHSFRPPLANETNFGLYGLWTLSLTRNEQRRKRHEMQGYLSSEIGSSRHSHDYIGIVIIPIEFSSGHRIAEVGVIVAG